MSREQQVKEAHYLWAKRMAETTLTRSASEQELRSLGRVPFFEAVEWADRNPPERIQRIIAAAIECVNDHDLQCEDSNGKLDQLKRALKAE